MKHPSSGAKDMVHIPDMAQARAFYASVFKAEFSAGDTECEMTIGDRRYTLTKRQACMCEAHDATVADADVAAAKAAVRGGAILSPVVATEDGARLGSVRDAFGHVWRVTSPAAT